MRVKAISIRKLFGRLDYTIPLALDERITIIHGPNGYGKTALLRLVHAMFHRKLDVLRDTPFESLRVDFEDDTYVEVRRGEENTRSDNTATSGILGRLTLGQVAAEMAAKQSPKLIYALGHGQQEIADCEATTDFETSDWLSMQELDSALEALQSSRIAQTAAMRAGKPSSAAGPSELLDILRGQVSSPEKLLISMHVWATPIHIVTVQRLLVPSKSPAKRSSNGSTSFQPAVAVHSEAFLEAVQETQKRYTQKAQHLDRTFPQRVMQGSDAGVSDDEALKQTLADLEARRSRLSRLGILPDDDTEFEVPTGAFDDATRKLLWVYARDVADKLSVFDELAAKVDLLQSIINERFQFKRLTIDMERGFSFQSEDGQALPPTALSSGEQHELVLLYECLFELKPDSLVLVDEPELSLHISWQVEFLRDLQRVIELAKLDVLIATHSPQIIHDRWDLTIDLQELFKKSQDQTSSPDTSTEAASPAE